MAECQFGRPAESCSIALLKNAAISVRSAVDIESKIIMSLFRKRLLFASFLLLVSGCDIGCHPTKCEVAAKTIFQLSTIVDGLEAVVEEESDAPRNLQELLGNELPFVLPNGGLLEAVGVPPSASYQLSIPEILEPVQVTYFRFEGIPNLNFVNRTRWRIDTCSWNSVDAQWNCLRR